MISGHRDTHFRFLKELRVGEVVSLEYRGRLYRYRISRSQIVDAREGRIPGPLPLTGLVLVTCYPFDALEAGGPLRYLLIARALPSSATA
jgi:sortase A